MADYDHKSNMGSFAAGLIGAVIGAASAVAVLFFSNKENRKKAQQKFEELKEKGTKAFHELQKKTKNLAEETEQRVSRPRRKK